MHAEWERKCDGPDNQDVGLEAAIIERVRNSSLVESSCADNPTGLPSMPPKPRMRPGDGGNVVPYGSRGRGVFRAAVKVERKHGWSARK